MELAVPPVAGTRSSAGSLATSFTAFGRRFDLRLESNERVIGRLRAANRRALPAHELYKGTLAGVPRSWVRLTQLPEGTHGLVFDGRELYVLAPAAAVADELDVPLNGVSATSTVAFRAADATSGLHEDFCDVVRPAPGAQSSSGPAPATYEAVFAELQQRAVDIAAAVPTRELDLALVADTQFALQHGDATGEMLARLNNVDGIFSSQVGVQVVSSLVRVLATNGGMTSNTPGTLLSQFEAYRRATPDTAARGLAHLMTGRDLEGSTAGIAYLGTLCATEFAASLSQTIESTYYSSLVAAHELGHNFGAPHDGVSGACATTAQAWLMAPAINGSSNFSQCSLDQIAPVVAAASCLTRAQYPDVATEAPPTVSGFARDVLRVPVDVVSIGTVAPEQATLRFSLPFGFELVDWVVADGTCGVESSGLVCRFGSLAPGGRRTVDIGVRAGSVASGTLEARVIATGDAIATNDIAFVQLDATSPANGSVTLSTSSLSTYVGETATFAVTAANSGPLALEAARIELRSDAGFTVAVAAPPGVACTVTYASVTCELGTLPAGQSRRIDVSLSSLSARVTSIFATLGSANDYARADNERSLTVTVLPLVELAVEALAGPSVIPLGGTITQSFLLRSAGPQPVVGAMVDVWLYGGIEAVSLTSVGATCGLRNGTTYRCTYAAPIDPGDTRRVDLVLKAVSGTSATVQVDDRSPESQHLSTSRGTVGKTYQLRNDVDLAMQRATTGISILDGRRYLLAFTADAIGINPAANAVMTVAPPAGVRIVELEPSQGTCSMTAAEAACRFGTLAPGTSGFVRVWVVADVVGSHTVEARVTADGDGNAANDATSTRLEVRPNVDLALESYPQETHVQRGSTVELPVTVRTATQPVSGAATVFTAYGGFVIVAAEPAQGACDTTATIVRCTLGAVPPNTAVTIVLRLRGETVSTGSLTLSATATGDVSAANNDAHASIVVDARGDVSIRSTAPSTSATVGSPVSLPRILVDALAPSDAVRVELTVPAALSIESATADGQPCSVDAGHASCALGALQVNASRAIDVRLRPNETGTHSILAQVAATDDADLTNNGLTIAVNVAAAGPNAAGGSDGGGGGGATGPAALMLLLLAPAVARRRRVAVAISCGAPPGETH